ncbi:TetR family transcriptional regulator [Glycomyces arizonensis]|uniref:TetR family transcriptional regulator n=1 Tax=Glycomyces arizonensis TaxID=256035 RepID=UPI0003FBB2F3|nr:TetR family transcriptional regulator [Glycomyces arizonensis]
MGRWEPNARGRLEEAALELFAERGFEQTTVAAIAERAGLTERTFFRHFGDKREVLFSSEPFSGAITEAVGAAPEGTAPFEAVARALERLGEVLQDRRERALKRQAVIAANPELQERELVKLASLARTMAAALRERGTPELPAILAAEAGIAVFRVAFERWLDDSETREMPELIRSGIDELKAVTGTGQEARPA